jgi:transposase
VIFPSIPLADRRMEHSPRGRVRIMVATKPIDFRKGHDSLAAMVKNELRKDPFTRCPAGDCAAIGREGGPSLSSVPRRLIG